MNDHMLESVRKIYSQPLIELISEARFVMQQHHSTCKIYRCTLLSYKTGGCPEDCAYCAQSIRYKTHLNTGTSYVNIQEAQAFITQAKHTGAERICISAAWKSIPENEHFENILQIGKMIKNAGLRACCTLGKATREQIRKLKEAGFDAYNHNIDTSRHFYTKIITTRTFQERLEMIRLIEDEGMRWCSGGIIGMGETVDDRLSMLLELKQFKTSPYSIPLNILVPIPGTPLENYQPPSAWEMLRLVATTRILFPRSHICLAAGRSTMTHEMQTLHFLAGANAIFIGDKLLTTPNAHPDEDKQLFKLLNI